MTERGSSMQREAPSVETLKSFSLRTRQSSKQRLTVCQIWRLFTWEVDLDLTKPLVLKSKQVKSFKTAKSLGDSSLTVSAQALAGDERVNKHE
ncbi:hypothetical protein PAMA_006616 [Pampus argenteus]